MGIPADTWGCGLPFIENTQAPYDPTGWGQSDTSNRKWGITLGEPYINVTVDWGITIPACPAYMPMGPENLRVAACRIRDDLRRPRRCDIERRCSRSCNNIVNTRLNSCGDDREGPVTQ